MAAPTAFEILDSLHNSCEDWDKAATRVQERLARERRAVEDLRVPQQRKVEVLTEVLKDLKKAEEPGSESIRSTEYELEQSQKELHMPYRAGWLFRVVYGGVMVGLQDFDIERCSASLLTSLVPGRQASGAQQAAVLRITLDASAGGDKPHLGHNISVRLERLRLERLSQSFSLIPHSVEVASLTVALRCVMHLTFAFGSDKKWVCSTSKLELRSLRTEKGDGGHIMSDMLIRWLLEKMLPVRPGLT
jgi:hypothetical protein